MPAPEASDPAESSCTKASNALNHANSPAAPDCLKKRRSRVKSLNASWVQSQSPIAIGYRLCYSASRAVSRGSVHVALGEEPLWGPTATVNDLGEVADGLGVKAGVEGCERGGLAA
ncbi:hypothetical protein SLA2020_423350 [Shorea laevis]